jgi:hypothetical protein
MNAPLGKSRPTILALRRGPAWTHALGYRYEEAALNVQLKHQPCRAIKRVFISKAIAHAHNGAAGMIFNDV